MSKIKALMRRQTWSRRRRRGLSTVLMIVAAIVGMTLVTGCGSAGNSSEAQHLEQLYPWLSALGLPFLEWLIKMYGSDILGLLAAAAVAVG
jgi:hypothetical protein